MAESLLTPEKAAQLLAVRPKTIRDWLKRGRLKGVRAGRLWRIRERDLARISHNGIISRV